MTTRRTFLRTGSLATVAALGRLVPRPPATARRCIAEATSERSGVGSVCRTSDPDLHALAMRALDAATSAGASYADVRFTMTRRRTFFVAGLKEDSNTIAMGVRALASGAWGFTSATKWTADGAAQLGRRAALLAKATAWPRLSPVELGERPSVALGHWETPITRDPFTVPTTEVTEFIKSTFTSPIPLAVVTTFTFERQDRTFASTEGAYTTQRLYTALGCSPHNESLPSSIIIKNVATNFEYQVPGVSPVGAGYEALESLGKPELLSRWRQQAIEWSEAKRFQAIGEYDVVFDAAAMASIVDGTFGAALEYDRAVGEEANSRGTSYLAPPANSLGTVRASPLVTLTADRTLPHGAATVRWDDEGVMPEPALLVKDGVIVDYATNRQGAAELASWYHHHDQPVRSHGCAASESALTVPLIHTPNLVLHQGPDATTFETLIGGIDHGYAICGGAVQMDMQQRTGVGQGLQVHTIVKGKLGVPVKEVAHTFKSQDLWRNVVALGGGQTAAACGLLSTKGEPNQVTAHTVTAVAAHVQNVQLRPALLV